MRIGIDFRILDDPLALMGRGVGRFTQQQLREVLRLDRDNEYILMCPPGSDRSAIPPDVLAASNVEAIEVDVPGFLRLPEGAGAATSLMREIDRWMRRHRIGLYHQTCPFVLDQPNFRDLDACATVATVYDLIPYLFADLYLVTSDLREAYLSAMRSVLEGSRILAISRTTAGDVAHRWRYPDDRIDITPPFAGDSFRPLPPDIRERRLRNLRGQIGLPRRFALTVSGPHYSKNLSTLLEAYSTLPRSFRSALPLVVCCHLEPSQVTDVEDMCEHFHVDGNVLLTGYLSDNELVALYNAAELLIHPSLYEGFGLPVLEAMQCGTPVIAARQSSLPEVAGMAAMLVDAWDAEALASALVAVSEDPRRQEAMRRAGLRRAREFSPERLGRSTLDAYAGAVASPRPVPAGGALVAG